MAETWKRVGLSQVVSISHGFAFSGEFINDEGRGDVLVTPGNFRIGGGFNADRAKYYGGPVDESFVLDNGDLIITMTDLSKASDTLGLPATVPSAPAGRRYLHNQRIGRVSVSDADQLDQTFLYYRLCAADYRHEVLAGATGTAIKHTSPKRILRFEFDCPSLTEQRAIAGVLGAIDDRIELNRRMVETLEEMARALFRSWFVDFEPVRAKAEGRGTGLPSEIADLFPDHLVDSDLGEIPDGWTAMSLADVCDLNPSRVLKRGVAVPYLDMASMPTRGHAPGPLAMREAGSGARFVNGDTLVARITPCLENGKTAFVDFLQDGEVGWGSTEYVVLRPLIPLPLEYGYLLARSDDFRDFAVQRMSGSSGRQRVSAEAIGQYRVANPPAKIANAFGRIVHPIIASAGEATRSNAVLAELRDALLPKLVSGELRIGDPEGFLERLEAAG